MRRIRFLGIGTDSSGCILTLVTLLAASLVLMLDFNHLSYAQRVDNDPHATGLIFMTPEEQEAFRKTHPKVEKVLLNEAALERINKERAEKGLPLLPASSAVPWGKEIVSSIEGRPLDTVLSTEELPPPLYPTAADNTVPPILAFPEIRSQGGLGSCTSFATVYYQYGYMVAYAHEWDNYHNPTDNTIKFSPKFVYNMVNWGQKSGSSFSDNSDVVEEHGAATWFDFPYYYYDDPDNPYGPENPAPTPTEKDYREWCYTDSGVWENAVYHRANQVQYIDVDPDDPTLGLDQIRALLAGEYIVTFGTYINSWQYKTTKDNTETEADDDYVDQYIAYWTDGTRGSHAMTFVGYNDDIWVDINKNRQMEEAEKGALLVANSWGRNWKNNGFVWLSYDALRATTAVDRGPYRGRVPAIPHRNVYVLTVKCPYSPKMLARFQVRHSKRNQLRINLGISDFTEPDTTGTPSITWYPGAISLQGGPYSFDGETTGELIGSFVFDFTDILPAIANPPESTGLKRYYLGVYDSTGDDNEATILSYEIVDVLNYGTAYPTPADYHLPPPVDDGQDYAYCNYTFNSNIDNEPPVAVISADPISGMVELEVTFDAYGSNDPDGNIVEYLWNFGDRWAAKTLHPTTEITHTYSTAGVFSAKVTVTDNSGASSSAAVIIVVQADPSKAMHVAAIDMSSKATRYITAYAEVTILNGLGNAVPGAQVDGTWEWAGSPAVDNEDVSGVTGQQGNVKLASPKLDKSAEGMFTFTVTDVTLAGYTYDFESNVEDSDTIKINIP